MAITAGMDVVLSNSRGPDTLAELVAELGDHARAGTPAQAANPMHAYDKPPVTELAGKTVIDTLNYYPDRDGRIAALDANTLTSSELVQRHLADSHVVKAFNNIDFRRLVLLPRPAGSVDRSALPIAGNDAAAKEQVTHLLDVFGYDAVDVGTLADSWRTEPNNPVYVQPYMPQLPDGLTMDEAGPWFFESPGVPLTASRVTELVGVAVRGPAGTTPPFLQS
ncbi:NADPH-dependent F420 reductase [Actinoallomurus soli]|uniref:NADPH-dependent F420 reductase n=1 Tax=Actinoallomurus soli TaxID=2952535 RepID=UPI002092FC66|nr:NADP oxidoreductase [Actinoallomurus soli]MCO5974864.1 NADP oxidoreductase [Actinoallomurus soli]